MSLNRYKVLDLTIFAAIVCFLEVAARLALRISPHELFSFSATLAVALIVFVRWGAWGMIHCALGGAAFALAQGGDGQTVLIYSAGSLAIALALVIPKFVPGEKLRSSMGWLILYTLLGFLGLCLGRSAAAFLLEGQLSFVDYLTRYVSAEALNGVITLVALYVAARQDGILEDQLSYLRRIAKKEEYKHANRNPE